MVRNSHVKIVACMAVLNVNTVMNYKKLICKVTRKLFESIFRYLIKQQSTDEP